MAVEIPKFPDEIWDGTTQNRTGLLKDADPNGKDWDRITAEMIALQNHVLTSGGSIETGTLSSRSVASQDGSLYLSNDFPVLSRDNGTTWKDFGPIWPITIPVATDFTWVNQNSATISNSLLTVPASASIALSSRVLAVPTAPYTRTALLRITADYTNNWHTGLIWRNSVSGKIHFFGIVFASGMLLISGKFSDNNTYDSTYRNVNIYNDICWFKIQDDGTNRKCYYSMDGFYWHLFDSQTRTDYFTPDQVGFTASNSNNYPIGLRVLSWQ